MVLKKNNFMLKKLFKKKKILSLFCNNYLELRFISSYSINIINSHNKYYSKNIIRYNINKLESNDSNLLHNTKIDNKSTKPKIR